MTILLTSLLSFSVAFAQSQNTGGRFKGGGSSSGAYSPNGNLTQLLRDPSVHDELDLDDAQVQTVERETKALADIEQQLRSHDPRSQSRTSIPALIEAAKAEMQRLEPLLWKTLNPKQREQIPAIQIKKLGADALLLKQVKEYLNITPKQSKRLAEIQDASRLQAIRSSRPTRQRSDRTARRSFRSTDGRSGFSSGTSSSNSGKLPPQERLRLQSERQRIIEAGHERMVREVLTEQQRTKFKSAEYQVKAK